MSRVFVIGASGYIGGSVAVKLIALGHGVTGLARSEGKAAQLRAIGIDPVLGRLNDLETLAAAARRADIVVNAADADNYHSSAALLSALAGSGKRFIHTSGTSVIADRAAGEPSDLVFNEDSPSEPLPERMLRVAVDRMVLEHAQRGVCTVVIRPSLIYGAGFGLNRRSLQVPKLVELAGRKAIGVHVGRGLNVWSNVHIADLVDLYLRAIEDAPPGSLFYAENGEASMREIAAAISRRLGFGGATRDMPIEEALDELGVAAYTSFGSNSRVRSLKARKLLSWSPSRDSLIADIDTGLEPESAKLS